MAMNHLGSDGSMDLGFGPDPNRPTEPAAGGTVTLSQEQFDALISRVNVAQENDYAAQFGEVIEQSQPQYEPVRLDQLMANLPDPARDPDGFKQGLGQAAAQLQQQTIQAVQNQNAATNLIDEAWRLMQQEYPEVAAYPELVELATTRERQALAQRGIDFRQVLAGNMEGAVAAVAQRAEASINRIRGIEGDGSGADIGRADVLPGGNLRAPTRPGQRQPTDQTGGLIDELKKIQHELGIY
jgi:hypothetical protein